MNPYSAIGEYLVYDVADFEVKISVESLDPSLIIVAGAPGEKIGNHWFFTLPAARTFAWSASSEYQILQQAENPQVVAYVLPEHVDAGWRALSASISAFNLYSSLFNPYPHQTLSLVEGDFPDGMEYDGLFFVGTDYFSTYQDGEENYLTLISAHETAHQWWFALVGNDPAREPWLDEALTTYSELLFYEVYYPGDEQWWWNFRVARYSPTGWVDQSVYNFSNARQYINAVYLNGALFLDQIRHSIGDEAFKAFLAEYCQNGKGKIITHQDFFDLLSGYTTADLNPIINQYFRYK
jgi:aminopeptidase N